MADAAIQGAEHNDDRGFLLAGLCQRTTKTSVYCI